MKRLLKALDFTEDWVMVGGIVAATGLVVAQVILRYVFNLSIYWAEEAVRYIVVWLAMIGAGMGVRHGKHVSVDILQIFLPERAARIIALTGIAIGCLFSLMLVWTGWTLVAHALSMGQLSSAMRIPMGWAYMILPITGVLLFVRFAQLGHALFLRQRTARADHDHLAREAGV